MTNRVNDLQFLHDSHSEVSKDFMDQKARWKRCTKKSESDISVCYTINRADMKGEVVVGTLRRWLLKFSYRNNMSQVDQLHEDFVKSTILNYTYNGLIPRGHNMYLPWNRSWEHFGRVDAALNERINSFQTMVHATAAVTLMPSPGELFWLKVDCVDGALADVETDISIEVSCSAFRIPTLGEHRARGGFSRLWNDYNFFFFLFESYLKCKSNKIIVRNNEISLRDILKTPKMTVSTDELISIREHQEHFFLLLKREEEAWISKTVLTIFDFLLRFQAGSLNNSPCVQNQALVGRKGSKKSEPYRIISKIHSTSRNYWLYKQCTSSLPLFQLVLSKLTKRLIVENFRANMPENFQQSTVSWVCFRRVGTEGGSWYIVCTANNYEMFFNLLLARISTLFNL